mmetsp:Transcript_2205/g.2488  ORF Transcript_2205/g.2488 Transcript_2205/m.2488 type:complete len:83 (-) Transcript_2205:198-446(-)
MCSSFHTKFSLSRSNYCDDDEIEREKSREREQMNGTLTVCLLKKTKERSEKNPCFLRIFERVSMSCMDGNSIQCNSMQSHAC